MNRGDIIRMATEATRRDDWWDDDQALERFAALVVAEKEKQIIDILERLQERNHSHNYYSYAIKVITGNI